MQYGAFYYTILNLPPSHQSCFANVHLLALCNSLDLKVHGYKPILERFVAEINGLQTVGFSGNFPVIGSQQIYVGLAQVACDNLALNGLFGFIECFSADYFCSICLATQNDIQSQFRESDFCLRTHDSYEADVVQAQMLPPGGHSHGVKSPCCLNEIVGFRVIENYVLDPMHILLEGVVPLELGCVLFHLISVKHYLSLSDLNTRMHCFFEKNSVDESNRPPTLNPLQRSSGLSPSMKAIQMLALLKYLPLVIGINVDKEDPHWHFLLSLCELTDYLFAPKFTKGMIAFMRVLISEHLTDFRELYGSDSKLRPKHHLLLHLPTVILENGPLVTMSCLRYEMKNSFFKRSSAVVCNFVNICKSLAYRHQCNAFFLRMSKQYLRRCITVGTKGSECGPASNYRFCACMCESICIASMQNVCVATKISVSSVTYRKNYFFVVGVSDCGEPVFGEAEAFVSLPDCIEWHVVMHRVDTVAFRSHFHAYEVQRITPAEYICVPVSDLHDYHPLSPCPLHLGDGCRTFVRLPYHIF